MGYNTDYIGEMVASVPFTKEEKELLKGLFSTRRMKRDIEGFCGQYGIEGVFYTKNDRVGVLNYNKPPSTQPSLWCDLELIGDDTIKWSGVEKTYEFDKWLEYVIKIMTTRNSMDTNKSVEYKKDRIFYGEFNWSGEEVDDIGVIVVYDNRVDVIKN